MAPDPAQRESHLTGFGPEGESLCGGAESPSLVGMLHMRQPGDSHVGRGISHRIVLREANVESGLSLLCRRAFQKPGDLSVSRGKDGQEEEQATG